MTTPDPSLSRNDRPPAGAPPERSACRGFFTYRPRWGLSWRGWLLALLLALAGVATLVSRVHPFLAVTERVEARALVVESWIPENALRTAAAEFQNGGYEVLYLVGTPPPPPAGEPPEEASPPDAARMLTRAGVPADAVRSVPGGPPRRDRTYGNAFALREWLAARQIPVPAFNVVTLAVHGRRSRIMARAAFGETAEVGIISAPDPGYDAARWWRYSRGVKEVVSEAAAYVYAVTLFQPENRE